MCQLQLWLVLTCAAQCSLLVPCNFESSSGQDPSLFSSRLLSQAPLPHPIPPNVVAERMFELWSEWLNPDGGRCRRDSRLETRTHQASPPRPAKDGACDQENGLAFWVSASFSSERVLPGVFQRLLNHRCFSLRAPEGFPPGP